MLKRKPLSISFIVLSILLIPISFLYSLYFLIATALLLAFYGKIPITTTLCPRCRKNNTVERWTRSYRCFSCRTPLRREQDGWSHIEPCGKQKGSL